MKVTIGPYVDRWISYVHDHYMRDKYGYNDWPETQTRYENFLEKLEDVLQWIYNHSINLYMDRKERKVKIKIHKYDTWSMDYTLAPIILPMLKQLKETKHGSPMVDNVDVPKELRATKKQIETYDKKGDVDPKHFDRWDWILDEMIWAFEQKTSDWEEQYYDFAPDHKFDNDMTWREAWQAHQQRMSNGFRLFGKYYESLWD
jgi:hypothetical protein